jgi:hypothetical protein
MIARREPIPTDVGPDRTRWTALTDAAASIRQWSARRWLVAVGVAAAFAVVAGVPTDVIPNPLASRQVPVAWWNYPVLAVTALLGGLLAATYVRSRIDRNVSGRSAGGGLLSVLAIACPACNKLVVMLVGTSGALSLWASLQPLLAIASIVLLAWALYMRLVTELSCPVPTVQGAGNV